MNQASASELKHEIAGLKDRIAELEEFIQTVPASTGVCCCGDQMDRHSVTSNHAPVDLWEVAVEGILKGREIAP